MHHLSCCHLVYGSNIRHVPTTPSVQSSATTGLFAVATLNNLLSVFLQHPLVSPFSQQDYEQMYSRLYQACDASCCGYEVTSTIGKPKDRHLSPMSNGWCFQRARPKSVPPPLLHPFIPIFRTRSLKAPRQTPTPFSVSRANLIVDWRTGWPPQPQSLRRLSSAQSGPAD